MLSHAQEILASPGLSEPAAKHATAVIDAISRSRELIRQLAELGRDTDAPAEAIALDASVGLAADFLQAMPRRGQRLDLDLAAPNAKVRFDRTHLDQVLINLVGNALDATGEGWTDGSRPASLTATTASSPCCA